MLGGKGHSRKVTQRERGMHTHECTRVISLFQIIQFVGFFFTDI